MKNRHQQNPDNTKGKVIDFFTTKRIHRYSTRQQFSEAAWRLAQSILWTNDNIDEEEQILCLDSIQIYFSKNRHRLLEAFVEFCERVVLAKWYVQTYQHRFIPSPAIWLNMNFSKGFKGTAKWYAILKERRAINPLHHAGLHLFALSYMDYVLNPYKSMFQETCTMLIDMQEFSLLQHFKNAVLNYHFAA